MTEKYACTLAVVPSHRRQTHIQMQSVCGDGGRMDLAVAVVLGWGWVGVACLFGGYYILIVAKCCCCAAGELVLLC